MMEWTYGVEKILNCLSGMLCLSLIDPNLENLLGYGCVVASYLYQPAGSSCINSLYFIILSSHVGHVFRKSTPYTFPGGTSKIVNHNNARLAEVSRIRVRRIKRQG